MADCIFCKIVRGEIPAEKIYEDETCLAFLDITPVNPGHTLLIPKEHYENLYELPEDVFGHLTKAIKKIAMALKEGVGAEGINLGMNNGQAAGQLVPHVHFHLMPRFTGDGYVLWHGKPYVDGEASQTAQKIKKFL